MMSGGLPYIPFSEPLADSEHLVESNNGMLNVPDI
jgi:hypothetical protein